jgi:hypothetical protein
MAVSEEAYRRLDTGIRRGLSLWSDMEREKRTRKEREEVRLGERKYREKQEARQQEEFNWKKEDRQKKNEYEVLMGELHLGNSLVDAGNIREGAARWVNAYNKKWPDGKEAILSFRSDKPDAESMAKWDRMPGLKGKEIALLTEDEEAGLLGFKDIKQLRIFINRVMKNPKEYLKAYNKSASAVAERNASEKPFQYKDGSWYIQKWGMGPGGNIKKDSVVPYTERTPVTAEGRVGLRIKAYEKAAGKRLTPSEIKEVRLGIKPPKKEKVVSPGKKLDQYKKSLDLVLRPFKSKSKPSSSIFDDEGDLTESGQNALDTALKLVEKADNNPESLTASEKKKLPHARRAWDIFSKISEEISAEYETEREPETGKDWRQYQRTIRDSATPQGGGSPALLPLRRTPTTPPPY